MPTVKTESEGRRPSAGSLRALRAAAERVRPDDARLREWFDSYAARHTPRLALDLDMVHRLAQPEQRIVEYGATPLLLTAALRDCGYRVTALDLAPERFSRTIAELGLDVLRCDIETQAPPLPDASADLVLFNELFEHLRINPIFTLKEVHRVLRPGGVLLLSTPNLRSLNGIRNFLFRNLSYSSSRGVFRQYARLDEVGHMGHVREYTTREVREFLQEIGFSVESVIFRGTFRRFSERCIGSLFPALRPFFTVLARR